MSLITAEDRIGVIESRLGDSLLAIAASRTVGGLGAACHAAIRRLTESTSVGLYTLSDGTPRLVLSRETSEGFLTDYAGRAGEGDVLVERMCDRRRAVDGRTELGAVAWKHSSSFDVLQRWGYTNCMGGPLLVAGRVAGVLYTAKAGPDPYEPLMLQRMDLVCRAGSVALVTMLEAGALLEPGGIWRDPPSPSAPVELPRRSRDVATLISAGRTNKEIGRDLGLSAHTVKDYVGSLCRRFDVRNRTELAHRLAELD